MILARYHPGALKDAAEARRWYGGRSAKAEERFRRELRAAIDQIKRHPGRGHPCGRFRRHALRQFPYHIRYLQRGDDTWIMVVRHDSRHPAYGMHRQIPENS